jgi:hypothetical protein
MLELILNRVAGVEVAIGNVAHGVANIMGDMQVLGRNVFKDDRAQSHTTTVPIQHDMVNATPCTHSHEKQGASQREAGGMVEDGRTPRSTPNEPSSGPMEALGTGFDRPIMVDSDNISNDLADRNAPVNRNIGNPGARVHSQPRLRAVLCVRKLLVETTTETDAESSAAGSPTTDPHSPSHNDPPVNNVTTGRPHKPPALHPKTNGVSHLRLVSYIISPFFVHVVNTEANIH